MTFPKYLNLKDFISEEHEEVMCFTLKVPECYCTCRLDVNYTFELQTSHIPQGFDLLLVSELETVQM